jgi:hypothetical protein
VRHALNKKLRHIGEITELSLNTKKCCVSLVIELAGEDEAVEIEIERYSIRRNENSASVVIEKASASREWLDAALEDFVIGRRFPIPPMAAEWIDMLT